jgi:hypothetical protein
MSIWEGEEAEESRVARYIRTGLRERGVRESPQFYFTEVDGRFLGCAEAIALAGMCGGADKAHRLFYEYRATVTGNMSPWQDFADLLRISPQLAHRIDWYHSRGIAAVAIANALMTGAAVSD